MKSEGLASMVFGVLYPGDMGAAVGRMLAAGGARVVTTLDGRGTRTVERARDGGFEVLPSLPEVVRASDVVISIVPPAASLAVASEYRDAALAVGRGQVFLDCNPLTSAGVATIEAWLAGSPIRFLDGAIHGVASRLEAQGTLYLAGPDSAGLARILGSAMRVRHLGDHVGRASQAKMLMGGMSKGLTALVVELGIVAHHFGLEEQALESWRDHYPGVMSAIDRMLPTYAEHAPRRADEMDELTAGVTELGLDPSLIGGVAEVIADLASLTREGRAGVAPWTIPSVAALLAERNGPPRRAPSAQAGSQDQQPTADLSTAPSERNAMSSQTPRSAELHPGPGFRVRTDFPRLDRTLMDRFTEFDTTDISDLLNRLYAVSPEISCLSGEGHDLCGPVCTVKVFPGDNLMVHKALDVARPGDIVVVDAGGSGMNAVLGDLISTKAKHRGIAGFIVDGLIRDLPAIRELDFPVYARGDTAIGPLHRGPGEINYPIVCGGTVVNPGDLIVADASGMVVVPRGIAVELLGRLESHKETNATYLANVQRGEFSNAWVDTQLEAAGCQVDGRTVEEELRALKAGADGTA